MEFSIELPEPDDARDLFLLAKERLLDVNDWNSLFAGKEYHIMLTTPKGQKLQRDAHVGDMMVISATNGQSIDMWVNIRKIQYDFFPDIGSESISMLLEMSSSQAGNRIVQEGQNVETILIKREGNSLTAHCNIGNELPDPEAETPNEHLNTETDLHPVLNIPKTQLQQLLQGFIAIDLSINT